MTCDREHDHAGNHRAPVYNTRNGVTTVTTMEWTEAESRTQPISDYKSCESDEEATEWTLREIEAKRDQLRKQVEKLLGAVENHRQFHVGGGLGAFHAAKRRSDEETREVEAQQDRNLWTAADQVRKELEG